MIKIWVWCWF